MIETRPTPIRRPSPIGRLWRIFLPVAIALMAFAVITGVGDDSSKPAWMFAGGAFVALIGVASLILHLLELGRGEMQRLEKRLEDRLDAKTKGRP